MKIFFLLNPSRTRNRWDWREAAARQARHFGWTARFGEVDRALPHSMSTLLDQALEEDCSRVVVVGGDGSIHRVLNGLAGKKKLHAVDIAIIPAGTCNDFARFMGLQRRKVEAAFRLACSGKAQPTDVALMDDELFLNNAGFGRRPADSEPRAVGASAPFRKRWKTVQALRAFRPTDLRVRWDKGSIEGSFYMALVCNAPYFSGGLHFSKNVNVRDGLLDVFLLPAVPKWQLLPVLALGRLGRPARFKRLISLRVPRLDVETAADVWPQADGEPPAKAVRRVSFSVSPEKAMIVAP